MAHAPHFQQLDATAPGLQPAIHRAEEELASRNLKRELYAVKVYRLDGMLSVTFTDRDAQGTNVRGSPGKVLGFHVRLDPETLAVKAANYIR